MQEPTYRVAIIGTGGIANHHAGYYAKHPRTTIVAAADIRPDALAAFCEKHNVPARYTDYRELLEKELGPARADYIIKKLTTSKANRTIKLTRKTDPNHN